MKRLILSAVLRRAQVGPLLVAAALCGTSSAQDGAPVFMPPAMPDPSSAFGSSFADQNMNQFNQGNLAGTFDPSLLPRLRYDPEDGLTTEVRPEFFTHLQTVPYEQREELFEAFGSINSSGPTALSWFATDLTPLENQQLNDLVSRSGNLSPAEQQMLQDLLEKSLPIPITPIPISPGPFTPPPQPPGIPPIEVGSICLNGKILPPYCQAPAAQDLPDCKCDGDR